jgi:hypothetical protein
MLSPAGQQSNVESIRAAGIEEALVKPVKQSRLYQCLTTVLSQDATSLALPEKLSIIAADGQSSATTIRILLAEDNLVNRGWGSSCSRTLEATVSIGSLAFLIRNAAKSRRYASCALCWQ